MQKECCLSSGDLQALSKYVKITVSGLTFLSHKSINGVPLYVFYVLNVNIVA